MITYKIKESDETEEEYTIDWLAELDKRAEEATEEQGFFQTVSTGIEAHHGVISVAMLAVVIVLLVIIAIRQKK